MVGRTVQVVAMRDDGWWVGRTPDGMEEGIFPGAYVTIISAQGNGVAASLIEEHEIQEAEREAERALAKSSSSSSSGAARGKGGAGAGMMQTHRLKRTAALSLTLSQLYGVSLSHYGLLERVRTLLSTL